MNKAPKEITSAYLNVAVMPNGEVIFLGKTLGWVDKIGKYISLKPEPHEFPTTPMCKGCEQYECNCGSTVSDPDEEPKEW